MSNKKHQAIINLCLDGDQVKTNVRGEKMDLFKMMISAMEHIEGFADIVVTASQSYISYQAKQARSMNQEKKEA